MRRRRLNTRAADEEDHPPLTSVWSGDGAAHFVQARPRDGYSTDATLLRGRGVTPRSRFYSAVATLLRTRGVTLRSWFDSAVAVPPRPILTALFDAPSSLSALLRA